jgi:hypothetical protein
MYNLQLSIAVAAQDGGSQGIAVTNRLYISSVHQTVAGCTVYRLAASVAADLPLRTDLVL